MSPSLLKLFFISLPIFLTIDMLWLVVIARSFYRQQIGHLMSSTVNWGAALLFYAIFLIGLCIFVIAPAMEKKMWLHSLSMGALFGIVTYATYDLTNYAVLKDWPLTVTIVDILWGMTLSATVSVLTYFIATKFA